MPLPSGFYLSKESKQIRTYEIPERQKQVIGEAKCIAIELLEELL
jgi:hypothetical protein